MVLSQRIDDILEVDNWSWDQPSESSVHVYILKFEAILWVHGSLHFQFIGDNNKAMHVKFVYPFMLEA